MIEIVNKKCIAIDEKTGERCKTRPSFNKEGEKAEYCYKHRENEMTNVNKNLCHCGTIACFNYPEEKNGKYCKRDKLKGMIDVVNKRCQFSNCPKHPSYNFPGKKKRKFCFVHKLDGMIDIASKRCDQCNISASFGPLFGSIIHCKTHKLANEFKYNNPLCEEGECQERAFYTNDGTNYPRRCEEHILPNDINIVEKPCNKCGLSFFLNEKSNLCNDCNEFFIKQVHKKKETEVISFLKQDFHFTSTDKKIEGGCSNYRPDAIIDYVHFLVVLEIDEHQHNSYPEKCEITRMISIKQDLGETPVVFVRYNPDSYKIEKDEREKIIKPDNKYRLNYLKKLLKNLETFRDQYIEKKYIFFPLSVYYLFYDNFSKPIPEEINIEKEIKTF